MSDAADGERKDKKRKSGDYEVGYGKPPKRTQFRKGTSGNPKGRPKRARNLRTVLLETAAEMVMVRQGDRTEKLPKGEALIKSLMTRALSGDYRAVALVLQKMWELSDEGCALDEDGEALTRDEVEIAKVLRERLIRSGNVTPQPTQVVEREGTGEEGERE